LLDRPDAEVLYGPWFNLVGAPPLPDQAPEAETKPAKAKAPVKKAAKPVAKVAPKAPAKGTATKQSKGPKK
jgi:hypothetical protein